MAHQSMTEAEATARPEPNSVDEAYSALDDVFNGIDPDDEPEADESEVDDLDGVELDEGDEGEQAESEPVEPAIAAPVSLTAEEKERYAQLPEEAQQFVATLEERRNKQVQEATTRAAEAQREAKAAAADAQATAKLTMAQQLATFMDHYAPQMPDPALAQRDPATFIALDAQYRAALAQHNAVVQQVQSLQEQAHGHFTQQEQAWQQEQARKLASVPEIANPETRGEFLQRLTTVGEELGYSREMMADASADDILALKTAAAWKADAEKWRAAQSQKMQRVRAAGKPNKPGTGSTKGQATATRRANAWDAVKQTKSADAMADWLEASGIL